MKTLIYYVLNGIRFNTHDFFIRKLAASSIDLFGLKFYAPWIMRLIMLCSPVQYQPSARNHHIFLPEVDVSHEVIYPQADKTPIDDDNAAHQSLSGHIEAIHIPNAAAPGLLAG
jgi:hypothetical protein